MKKARATITIELEVDLDAVPGFGHEVGDWEDLAVGRLEMLGKTYNATAKVTGRSLVPCVFDDRQGEHGAWVLASTLDTPRLLEIAGLPPMQDWLAMAKERGWTIEEVRDGASGNDVDVEFFAWRGGHRNDPEEETGWCGTALEAAQEACQLHPDPVSLAS